MSFMESPHDTAEIVRLIKRIAEKHKSDLLIEWLETPLPHLGDTPEKLIVAGHIDAIHRTLDDLETDGL